jgi:hypothetical protein
MLKVIGSTPFSTARFNNLASVLILRNRFSRADLVQSPPNLTAMSGYRSMKTQGRCVGSNASAPKQDGADKINANKRFVAATVVTFSTSAPSIIDLDHRCITSCIICLTKKFGIGVDLAHSVPDSFVLGASAVQLADLYRQKRLSGSAKGT